ncbi:MAG: amidase [Gammaproteobacteria bacterium]|nr:amidase [Gammaproteobacteria bacterium]
MKTTMSAVRLAKAIRDREMSSREVVQAHLDRIKAVNGKLNAITVTLDEMALHMADEADRAAASGARLGPLHGVPITVKENIDLMGSATSEGVVSLKDALPDQDAPLVSQLKRAGAIPIARTNMPDFGLRWHTDNALWGATLNPWDHTLTPGGSSGGEAAALAAGMTPLGVGNDYGGSLRFPAQCCGIAALRPSLGRVPKSSSLHKYESKITSQLFSVEGPMARYVQDLRLALAHMSAPDPRDPWHTPVPLSGPEVVKPVKVAMTLDPAGLGVDAAVAGGIRKAARALSEAGYIVEETEPPLIEEAINLCSQLLLTQTGTITLPQIASLISPDSLVFLQHILELFPQMDLSAYMTGLAERNRIARAWRLFQMNYPLVLGPVSTAQPFKAGYDTSGGKQTGEIMWTLRLTIMANFLGLPAAALPVDIAGGLPQAVQIIGPPYREDLCLDAAETIEQDAGFRNC